MIKNLTGLQRKWYERSQDWS